MTLITFSDKAKKTANFHKRRGQKDGLLKKSLTLTGSGGVVEARETWEPPDTNNPSEGGRESTKRERHRSDTFNRRRGAGPSKTRHPSGTKTCLRKPHAAPDVVTREYVTATFKTGYDGLICAGDEDGLE